MTLVELIALYRIESNDRATPPFVDEAQLTEFANEAEEEACRRAELLRDSTAALCSLAFASGVAVVSLDPRIIDMRRVRLASDPLPLSVLAVDEMDELSPAWEDETGTPRAVVTGYQSNALRLYPIPTAADTLRLTVTRLPLEPMANDDDAPEICASYHRALVQWMLYRVYSIQDSELLDTDKAAKCLANFEREFGRRQSARNEQWRAERHSMTATPIA